MLSFVRSTRAVILVAVLLGGAASIPATAADTKVQPPADASTACPAEKPKKRGGLKGLLSAAKRAGVSQMLVGQAGMLGNGRGGQIASAVAGTAIEAAATDTGQASADVAQVPAMPAADCTLKPSD